MENKDRKVTSRGRAKRAMTRKLRKDREQR